MLPLLYKPFGTLHLAVALCSGAAFLVRTAGAVLTFVIGDYTFKIGLALSFALVHRAQQSLERIISPMGILLRSNRFIQSEGAFGVVKQDYGFQRFLHWDNKNVFTEILIVSMGYNINKYHNKIQQNRTRSQLHGKLIA